MDYRISCTLGPVFTYIWRENQVFLLEGTVPFEKLWFRFRFRLLKKLWFRFRFLLLESYGSGSIKSKFFLKICFLFTVHSKLFYKEKDYKYQQIHCKMWKKKMLNEGNQIHNFISSSGSGTVIYYGSGSGSDFLTSSGSGSTRQKVTVPTVPVPVLVPVPQHWREDSSLRPGTSTRNAV